MKLPFVCEGCKDTISLPKNISDSPNYCKACYEMFMAKACVKCGKGKKRLEYWGLCEQCWKENIEETEEENKRLSNGR